MLTSGCRGEGEEDNDSSDGNTDLAKNMDGRNTEGFHTSFVARVSGPGVEINICTYIAFTFTLFAVVNILTNINY